MNTPTKTTIATYNQVANQYLLKNQDRSVIETSLNRFTNYVTPNGLVLDIGCGPGFDAAILRQKGFRVHALDYSLGMLQEGQKHFPGAFVQADMQHLPFGQIADGLWVNASLLHIERDKVPLVLQEFYQILKPGGILYLSVQTGTEEKWQMGTYSDTAKRWFTYWTLEAIKECLTKSGFDMLDHQTNTIWLNIYTKKRTSCSPCKTTH